jgi:hypothetical protein
MRVQHIRSAAVLAFVAAAVAVLAAPGSARMRTEAPGPWCGGPLWRLLTLSDADRGRINLVPVDTDISTIAKLVPPKRIGAQRTTQFQKHAWRLEVVVDRYRIGSDGEIALVLYDIPSARYMNAYLPNPACLSARTPERRALVAARAELTQHCARVTPSWQLLGISARITGVGFWNPSRITKGALSNGAELRPIVDFQIVSGCGVQ